MSNKVIILWIILVISIFCAILVIAKNEGLLEKSKNKGKYDSVIISYIENNEIEFVDDMIKIQSEDLEKGGYIEPVIKNDSKCSFEALVSKDYEVKYNYKCKIIVD